MNAISKRIRRENYAITIYDLIVLIYKIRKREGWFSSSRQEHVYRVIMKMHVAVVVWDGTFTNNSHPRRLP